MHKITMRIINTDVVREAFVKAFVGTHRDPDDEASAENAFNDWLHDLIVEAENRGFDEGQSYCERRH